MKREAGEFKLTHVVWLVIFLIRLSLDHAMCAYLHRRQLNESSDLTKLAVSGSALALAVPMTLNNLAGGVAGGLSGSGPLGMGLGALMASFVFMASGHCLGRWASAGDDKKAFAGSDPRLCSAFIFFGLATSRILDLTYL